jgi:hypothetical protein
MTQQLAFHRKLECAHCWGKRHGEYHNDHSHYAYGGSCCCRYRLRRVGTLTSTEHGGKRRSVTALCHTDMPTTCYRGTVVGDDAMHVADYIVFGGLIACMLWAGAMALHKAR